MCVGPARLGDRTRRGVGQLRRAPGSADRGGRLGPWRAAVASRTGLEPPSRFTVIPNFVPDDIVVGSASLDDESGGGPLLYVGDVTRDKGVDVLLDAYRLVANPPALVLAGRLLSRRPLRPACRRRAARTDRADGGDGAHAGGAPGRGAVDRPRRVSHGGARGHGRRPTRRRLVQWGDHRSRRGRRHRRPRSCGGCGRPGPGHRGVADRSEGRRRHGAHGHERVLAFTASAVAGRVEALYRQVAAARS